MFKYLIYKFGQFWANLLPLKIAYRVAMFVSDLQYFLSPRDQRAVKDNLRVILSTNGDVSQMAREVFRNFGKYLIEFFRTAQNIDKAYIEKNTKVSGIEFIDRVLAQKKGGIILTAHIGNWELGGAIINALGYPIVAIALPHKERPVNDLFNEQRQARGITVVPTNTAIRRCIETLKENGLVALLADRDFGSHGEILDFLGKKVMIPRGPAVFSVKTGAPIVPAFLIRTEDDAFTLSLKEPIWPDDRGSENDRILKLMKVYTFIIEEQIRKNPTQWLMFRRFWCA